MRIRRASAGRPVGGRPCVSGGRQIIDGHHVAGQLYYGHRFIGSQHYLVPVRNGSRVPVCCFSRAVDKVEMRLCAIASLITKRVKVVIEREKALRLTLSPYRGGLGEQTHPTNRYKKIYISRSSNIKE